MWRLEHSTALWWWLLIPIAIMILYYLHHKRNQKLQSLGNVQKIRALIISENPNQIIFKRGIWMMAIALIILAMSNLQSGEEEESVTNKGANVIVALDLSNSMNARDIAPDRLERSKKFLTNLVGKFGGDRIAFIVFAGKAYIQMPFTTDYGAFEMQLKSINTDMMPTQGTALGEAIQTAESMQGSTEQEQKILILLSDGEDHDSKAINMAKVAGSKNMIIHTIGVGTSEGAPIPERGRAGGVSYKKDQSGNQVLSKLNEDMLKEIAQAGGGKYFNISNQKQALKEIQRSIKWASTGITGQERTYTKYKNYFQWFLFPAILLLMIELAGIHILSFKKSKNVTTLLLAIIGMLFFTSCKSSNDETKAFEFYQNQQFHKSQNLYLKTIEKDSSAKAFYNIGSNFLALHQIDTAISYFEQSLQKSPDTLISAQALFNKACALFQKSDYQKAADDFKNVLRYTPGNYRAQYNLSLALAHIPPQDPEQQKDKDQQDQDKDNKDQDNKDSDQKDKDNKSDDQKDQDKKDQDQKNKDDQKNISDEQKDQDKKEQDKKNKENQDSKSAPKEGKLSPQDVKRLYEALDQQEKAVQKRIMTQQKGEESNQRYIEKDW